MIKNELINLHPQSRRPNKFMMKLFFLPITEFIQFIAKKDSKFFAIIHRLIMSYLFNNKLINKYHIRHYLI
jgi:hypothetical protein